MKQRRIVGKPWDNTSKKTVNTVTNQPMTWEQWQRIEIDKKIAQENFPSHNPPKKTLWDKLEKDPVYYSTLKGRVGDCEEPTMGNRKMAYIKR